MDNNIKLPLNQYSNKPFYEQLKEIFRLNIVSGKWKPGDKIPIQQELSEKYGVSLAVVRQAVQLMVNEGSLTKIQGKGTFVLGHRIKQGPKKLTSFTQELRSKGWKPSSKILEAKIITDETAISEIFGISPKEEIIKISRLRFIDNDPLGIQTFFCPHKIAEGILKKELESSLYEMLENDYGLKITSANEKYYATILEKNKCELLGVEYPYAGFFVERLGKDSLGRVVEYTESYILSDKYVVEIQLDK